MDENSKVVRLRQPEEIDDPLTAILRAGARRLLEQAIEAEVESFLASLKEVTLPDGRERVVRHGHGPERTIQTGIGPVAVRRAKVRDRGGAKAGERVRFTSAILPRWARRTKSLDALLPVLYLRGVSTGDFQDALSALLGRDAPNLSPSVIGRLKEEWATAYARWQKRDLSARRWVHKTANVLNKVAKTVQPAMKQDLPEIWMAPDRAAAETAMATFVRKYALKYAKAVECLTKDRAALLAFYDFPAEHWDHIRTSNPIESVFATVRHRTFRTKGALSQDTAKLMVFKLVSAAAKTWRRLQGENQLPKMIRGVTFRDGIEVTDTASQNAA
ncbi:transposase [Azospirillum brasilense]|uniref:Mutator family transposase n=1 Tax=Azospirillum brasilense TaxID=192 RepID=A0A6L3ARJ1_AZOBR|nr:transposase [Azospirillum brasilense]KAA0676529.1 IS256 family transposase [Azospirillum brasilense]